MSETQGGVSQAMSAMQKPQPSQHTGEAGNPFRITVTEWSVSYTSEGNLVAQCKLQPDADVTIVSASISISLLDAPDTPIFVGAGSNSTNAPGVLWFAAAGSPYPGAKGTTVLSTINGVSSSSAYGYVFQKQFTV